MGDSRDALLVEREGFILKLTLNRPDALNALNRDMQHALEAELRAAGDDPDVRAIVITGSGRGFCSGADMGLLRTVRPDAATRLERTRVTIVPKG